MALYHRLSEDEEDCKTLIDSPDQPLARPAALQRFPLVVSAGIGALLASLVWTVFLGLGRLQAAAPAPSPLLGCGNSSVEARELGCRFQTWSYSWEPPACFDEALESDFLRVREQDQLPYYLDREGQQPVDWEVVARGDLTGVTEQGFLWTVWRGHFWHCTFLLRKFFRGQAGVSREDLDAEHLHHCQHWMADPFRHAWDEIIIKVPLTYDGRCDVNIPRLEPIYDN
ncbi:hypothetical protein ASPZODRAFT_147593 [Penicilliopsis zonata CBS 506.65]|uniref:Uncharacterized protein n=1 Tax=Penicilliopsis zonata CBS 506.65 TaxID=1073090 RepID=A0A1L9S552_9EURO|nr:hypothetical protein ASPZODRAFT_147593 [Penicilliopsis zonata CBS 506.65]OJJ42288.1 hypothetical protein ASPZODRAFT_147593 [Penicilliopsis zonata CBS 506.65]